jgi:hypothetical protein
MRARAWIAVTVGMLVVAAGLAAGAVAWWRADTGRQPHISSSVAAMDAAVLATLEATGTQAAIADGLIDADESPAHRVATPRRLPSTRRALSAEELDAINKTARNCGNDTVLDALLLRLHTETACRRRGALGLRLMDLDAMCGLVRLTERAAPCAGSRSASTWPQRSPITAAPAA